LHMKASDLGTSAKFRYQVEVEERGMVF